jgi:chromosome segregation ATPase
MLSPPFGFFKKKDSSKESNRSGSDRPSDGITLDEVSDIIEKVISRETKSLIDNLEPVKRSVENVLDNLSRIVEDLSKESLKTDDKFQSLAENSRRTIVATVMRESSSEIPLPKNLEEAKAFTDRIESLLKRCGDASGSHRRVLNEYMKKYSNRMKGEFESLSHLRKKAHELVSKQEIEIERSTQCLRLVKNLQTQIELNDSDKIRISNLIADSNETEKILDTLNDEQKNLKSSAEYAEASKIFADIRKIQDEREQLKKDISHMFSNISRAITKYSYGTSKATYSRLEKMANRPWEIFEEDLGPYFQLLHDIRQEIVSQKLVLKDSSKVIDYLDQIVNALESFSQDIKSKEDSLYRLKTSGATLVQEKLQEIEEDINNRNQSLKNSKMEIKELEKTIDLKSKEISELSRKIEEEMENITGNRYRIRTSYS